MKERITGNNGALSRRDFLRTGVAAAAAGAVALGTGSAFAATDEVTVNGLPATVFGRTGLKVTKIAFGGLVITEPSVLMRGIDQGINFVHTSPYYQNGRSIEIFGKVMKTHRKKVVLVLKARPENLEKWLKVLNTDYVDMLVPPLHSLKELNDPSIPENFEKARKSGMCGFMGFACHKDMTNMFDRSRELGYFDLALMSYGDADNPDFIEAARKANQAGMGILAMKGLPKRDGGGDPELQAQSVARCSSMLTREHVHSILATQGSFQSVDFYRNVLETKLSRLNQGANQRYWAQQQGNYCSMCGSCSGVCPAGVDISRVVRYRMYHQDYGLTDYARTKYSLLPASACGGSCTRCGLCESVCKRNLPIRQMLGEAHAMLS